MNHGEEKISFEEGSEQNCEQFLLEEKKYNNKIGEIKFVFLLLLILFLFLQYSSNVYYVETSRLFVIFHFVVWMLLNTKFSNEIVAIKKTFGERNEIFFKIITFFVFFFVLVHLFFFLYDSCYYCTNIKDLIFSNYFFVFFLSLNLAKMTFNFL